VRLTDNGQHSPTQANVGVTMYCIETVNSLQNFNFPTSKAEFVALEQNEDELYECMAIYITYKTVMTQLKTSNMHSAAELNSALELMDKLSTKVKKYTQFMNMTRCELGFAESDTPHLKTKASLKDLGWMSGAMVALLQKLERHDSPITTLETHKSELESIFSRQKIGQEPSWEAAKNELSNMAEYWQDNDKSKPPHISDEFVLRYLIALTKLLASIRPKQFGNSNIKSPYNFSGIQNAVQEIISHASGAKVHVNNIENLRNDLSKLMKIAV
jgi:hypothetical protein